MCIWENSSSELWDSLKSEYENGESGSAKWWVYGTVYFNLSSMKKEEAISIFKKLLDSGIPEYSEKEIQIWSQTRPTIQNQV